MAYRIRELREKKKLTQEQLAQMSGVSRTTIVLLENNEEHEAMVGTLKSLAAALNVPVSKLFTQKVYQDAVAETYDCRCQEALILIEYPTHHQ